MNEAGNEVGSVTVELPEILSGLMATRAAHGADSPIGHRCSNILSQIDSFKNARSAEQKVPPYGELSVDPWRSWPR